MTNAEWINRVKNLVGDSYIFLAPYRGTYNKIPYYHVDCGTIHYMCPHNFSSGKRCPECNKGHKFKKGERKGYHTGTPRKTNAEYISQLKAVHGDKITLLDTYYTNKEHLHFRCNVCHNILYNFPNDMLKHGCKYCVAREKVRNRKQNYRMPSPGWSNGEKLVATYLFLHKITYQYAVSFPGLRDINNLTYDFCIPNKKILIEYQGIQHYKPCTWNKRYSKLEAKKRFRVQQKHDSLKKEYANKHGYTLIAISYRVKTISKLSELIDSELLDTVMDNTLRV